MLLSLPTFAPAIPLEIELGGVGIRHLRLALAMSRLGLITDEELNALGGDNAKIPGQTINRLIEDAFRREIGTLYDFKVLTATATLLLSSDPAQRDFFDGYNRDVMTAAVILESTYPEWMTISKSMLAVEAVHQGLGGAVLKTLDRILGWFGYPQTPSGTLDMCRDIFWMGADDEREVICEVLEEGEDEADLDVVRRNDVFANIPVWAYDRDVIRNQDAKDAYPFIESNRISDYAVTYAGTPVGPLLTTVGRLADLLNAGDELLPSAFDECEVFMPPVVLAWNDIEQFNEIIDRHDNYVQEGESGPWAGIIEMPLTEEEIQKSLRSICHTGQALKALDEALILMKEFES